MMDDYPIATFQFDLNDLFETQTVSHCFIPVPYDVKPLSTQEEDDFLNLNTLSVLADGNTDQFFDVQASLPNELLEQQDSVEHDHQYCGEQQRPRKRKLATDDSLFLDVSTVCLACYYERTNLNEYQICTDCQVTNDLVSLYDERENQEESGRNSESGEDNGEINAVHTGQAG